MTEIIGIIFFACIIIAFVLEDKKSSKEFYENRIKEIERKKSFMQDEINLLRNKLEQKEENFKDVENFVDSGYSSINEYNDVIEEIEKDLKYSPLERIYYEAELPDQLKKEVSLRIKTQEYLNYLQSKGISQNDKNSAKEIIKLREDILNTKLTLKSFVQDVINQKGKYVAEEIYLGLVKIFELADRDISNSKQVYIELFDEILF